MSVCLELTLQTVLVFGPESVSLEQFRRETAAIFHHFFGARLFLSNYENVVNY